MPLPANGTPWPPQQLAPIAAAMRTWEAWWAGDPDKLAAAYTASTGGDSRVRPGQMAGGVVGAVSRFFWGRPNVNLTQPNRKLHVPIATDLCQAGADLLWSEAPTLTVDATEDKDAKTQARLDELIDDGALQVLAEGAEAGAALGGHFLRVSWDRQVRPDGPFLSVVDADAALPDFRWGKLVGVTFWHVVRSTDTQVWRHLERHELDAAGNGIVLHGLYLGTRDNLGRVVPLADDPSTAQLASEVNADAAITTASRGLAVVYVPNARPQRRWRSHPLGRHLGRSDLDGVEGMMDALDETYSSWLRDVRLGKARLLVSSTMLDDEGPGRGVSLDLDREVYAPLNTPPGPLSSATAGGLAQAEQFAIRHEEHRATAYALVEQILRTAGYSPATFGIDDGVGAAMTATEVQARQQRSYLTRGKKLRLIRPALADVVEKLLAVDVALFGGAARGVRPLRPSIDWPDGVQDSLLTLAQTAQALRTAEAASTETLVSLLHPDWDDQAVKDETARIAHESGLSVLPDPTSSDVIPGATPPGADPAAQGAPFGG